MGGQELGVQDQAAGLSPDAEDLGDHGEHEPACGAGQVVVHSAAVGAEVFRYAGVDMAGVKIQGRIGKGFQGFPALFREAAPIEGVGVHDGHMGKDRAVFLFPVGKSEHAPHIEFQFMKICIQAVAADFLLVEIMVSAFGDPFDMRVLRGSAHDGKDLSCQHHADLVSEKALHRAAVVVVVAVEPAFPVGAFDPFMLPQVFHEPVGLLDQIDRKGGERNTDTPSAERVPAPRGIVGQDPALFVNVAEGFRAAVQQDRDLFQELSGM